MPKIGKIPRKTQIVQNDILMEEIMSALDHLMCKCNKYSKFEKTQNRKLEVHPSPATLVPDV